MAIHPHSTADAGLEVLLERLSNVHPAGRNQWRATCPAHGSGKNQALSICLEGDRVLLHCFAGCSSESVLERLDLTWRELHEGSERRWNPAPRAPSIPRPDEGQRSKLERLWAAAKPLDGTDPASRYLEARGLRLERYPVVLRLHPALEYFHEGISVGRFPAMLARVEHPEHGLVALHRIYLKPDGSAKADVPSPKKLTGPVFEGATKGAAIRLYNPVERLALAEGIETALAVHLASGWPVWACVRAGGLERVELPSSVQEVMICADHDPVNPQTGLRPGLAAADALARRLLAEGRTVRLAVPPTEGQDWLDVYLERGAA